MSKMMPEEIQILRLNEAGSICSNDLREFSWVCSPG